jgi:hypothetical protein
VSARGATSGVSGVGNVMSGTGDRAVDIRTDASVSGLSGTDTSGWAHKAKVTFISCLEFHPLASLWLGILVVILLAAGWSFRRKLPDHPYPASVRSTYAQPAPGEWNGAMEPRPAHRLPAAVRATVLQPVAGRPGGRRATPPAVQNTPTWTPAGRSQPASRPQPPFRPAPSGPHPAYREPARHEPAYREPGYREPAHREPAYREPAYREPAYREPAYREPAYREPAPGPRRRQEPMNEPAPTSWQRPVPDGARWPQPAPQPLPAAPASRPEAQARHGGPGDNRATRVQQALPSEVHRPSGRERPAEPAGEDVSVTRPIPKGLWE